MTPCSFICWLDDIFWPKRSGIICSERRDIIWHQLPNLALWENSNSHFPTLESETVFILHQEMRETSQKMMREMVDESTENEKKRDTLFGACHHHIKKIQHVASEFDNIFNLSPTSHRCSTFDQQLCWCTFVTHHTGRIELKRHLHMSMSSFDKLLSYIRESLKVDSNMA